MPAIDAPLELYMSSPVLTVRRDASLDHCHARLRDLGISSLAVLDGDGELTGVISRTDLLRVGRLRGAPGRRGALLELPSLAVADAMTLGAIALTPSASIAIACDSMIDEGVHRVYVTDRGALVGVLSTHDVLFAIRDERLDEPISAYMSSPVLSVAVTAPIADALARLEHAQISGLIAVDGDWPVGLFTQYEALAARERDRATPVDDVMDPAMICLDVSTPLHRAAAQAAAVRARRIIACKDRHMAGVLSGLDFARAATGANR